MGDVKPPSGGTGDSGVLLLIHESGSNFSDSLETFLRTTTISMLHKPTASTFPIEEEKAGSRVVCYSYTHQIGEAAAQAKRGKNCKEGISNGRDDQMMASCTDDAQHAVCGAE